MQPWDPRKEPFIGVLRQHENRGLGALLKQLLGVHPDRQMILVMYMARSHKAKDLVVPENVSLEFLPPYSPEHNQMDILWHELRE